MEHVIRTITKVKSTQHSQQDQQGNQNEYGISIPGMPELTAHIFGVRKQSIENRHIVPLHTAMVTNDISFFRNYFTSTA